MECSCGADALGGVSQVLWPFPLLSSALGWAHAMTRSIPHGRTCQNAHAKNILQCATALQVRLVRRGLAKAPTICRAKGSQGFSVSSLSGKSDHAGSIRTRHGHMRGTKRAKEKTVYRQSTGLNPLTNLVRCQTRHQLMPPRRWSCRPKRHHAIIAMQSLCPQGLWDNVPTAAGAKRARFCHSVLSSVQLS